jgi:asparagine synthetase B (glutamine-hydrolysing)
MPGIFGGVGCDPGLYESLQREFIAPWGYCEVTVLPNGILGGHAFRPAQALHRACHGIDFAVDGEAAIYRVAPEFALRGQPTLFCLADSALALTATCKGNVVAVDPQEGLWHMAVEWTGSFPLYYTHLPSGLLFCSRLKPLARILGASPDVIAIRELLHGNCMLAGRSFFQGMHRLMPGQSLTYDPSCDHLRLRDTSEVWVGMEDGLLAHRTHAAKVSWDRLMGAMRHGLDTHAQHALMLSGGWDSRTLLAAMKKYLGPDKVIGYTHGDLLSRELRLAERICQASGIRFHKEDIGNAMLDLESLQRGFDRVETVIFPEWHWAGQVLVDLGVRSVSAGIYGEVLGGHHGSTDLAHGYRKIPVLAAQLLGWPHGVSSLTPADVCDSLRIRHLGNPWYVQEVFWDSIDLQEAMNADIEATLQRLRNRGIASSSQLIEAFITEHRSAQCTNAQLLSCRASLDISIPFGDRDFYVLASRIPLTTKIYNTVNREMLRQQDAALLRFPTAATLVLAAWPIWLQEASRLIRYLRENMRWRLHFATHSYIQPPHLGWWYWEFLRNGAVLNALVDDLQGDFWNKSAIRNRIKDITRQGLRQETHSPTVILCGCLFRAYNVDLMLR